MNSDDQPKSVPPIPRHWEPGEEMPRERFARMPGTGLPKGARRKKMKVDSSRNSTQRRDGNRIIRIWSALLFGLVVAVLGGALWLWMSPKIDPEEKEAVHKVPTRAVVVRRAISKFPSPSSPEALALVKQALSIREPERIAEYFRLEGTSPQEAVTFLQAVDAREGKVDRMMWLSSLNTVSIPLDGVLVSFKNKDQQSSRVALLTPDAMGKWQLDYAAFARTGSLSWDELMSTKAPMASVRVYIKKDVYYNGPFLDDKQWTCYQIGSPDTDEIFLAYSRVGSAQGKAMAWMLSRERKLIRAILEIRRVEGGESRQFEISRVLAEDWVMGETPFDDGFK